MWTRSFSKVFRGISREEAWCVQTDVNNWPTWHGDLESCHLEGSFEVGNHFFLKPKGMKAFKIALTAVEEGFSFTDCTTFFGAKMYDTHEMEDTPEGVRLTNKLVVAGPLSWLWIKVVAQNIAETVPEEMEALVKLIRARHE